MTSSRTAARRTSVLAGGCHAGTLDQVPDLSPLLRRTGRIGALRSHRRLLRRLDPALAGRYRRRLRRVDRAAHGRGAFRLRLRMEQELRAVCAALRQAADAADTAPRKKARPSRRSAAGPRPPG